VGVWGRGEKVVAGGDIEGDSDGKTTRDI